MKRKSLLFLLLFALIAPWAANAQNSLPYNEGFESMSSASDLTTAGWISYQSHTGSFLDIETTASNVQTGSNALKVDSWNAGSNSDYVILGLPLVDATINGLQITFSFKSTNTSSSFVVGYLTDANDASTFVALSSSFSTSSSYQTKTVELNEAPTDAARIAIKNIGYYRCYVDDIEVKALPTCIKPTLGQAQYITEEGASFQWTENGSATSWVLEYSTDQNFTNATSINRSGIPGYAITGLTPGTLYYVRLKSNCGGGDESDWSNIVSFTTLCEPINAEGYSENFDSYTGTTSGTTNNLPDCWNHINTCSYSSYSGYPIVYSSNAFSSPNDLRFYSYYSSYSNYDPQPQYAILPPMNGLAGMQVTLQARGYNVSSTFKIGTMSDASDASSFTLIAEQTGLTTSYQEFVYLVPANCHDSFLAIMIDAATSTSTAIGVYIDNIVIATPPSCFKPTDLEVTATTTTAATLSWTNPEGQTAWQICLNGDETNLIDANSNPFTIENLNTASTYTAKVRANCGNDDYSEWSNIVTFDTDCEAITVTESWSENFNSLTAGIPVCWDNSEGTTTTASHKWNYYATGYEGAGLRFNSYSNSSGNTNFLKTPTLNFATGKVMQLSFWFKNPTGGDFSIYISTDGGTTYTTALATGLTGVSSWTQKEIVLTDYVDAQNVVIVFKGTSNYGNGDAYIYLDDVVVSEAPTCTKPTNLTVVASSVTAHTAQLSWTSAAEAWEICLNGDEEHPVAANTNPFELTGLTDGTAYTAKVRAVCDGTYSEWSNTVSFTTPIACPAPTGLAVSGTTDSQTTLNWTGTSDSYDVIYRTAAYADGVYEQFNTANVPSRWMIYSGLVDEVIAGTTTLSSTTGYWMPNVYALGEYNMRLNIYGTSIKHWLVTPKFEVSQDLRFDLALTDYGNADPIEDPTAQADDRFVVLIYANETWTILREWNNSGSEYVYNTISTTGENVSIDLSAYYGQDVKIAFYGESTASGGDNDLHIDNVYCGIPHEAGEWQTAATGVTDNTYTLTGLSPETDYEAKVLSNCEGETGHEAIVSFTTEAACMVPNELEVLNTTPTTAVLTWMTNSTAWQIQVNEEDPIDVTENPYTLEGLSPATTYSFKVRANCDGTYTDWSESMSFTTECGTITAYPWEEDFNSYSTTSTGATAPSTYPNDNLPLCWQFLNRSETTSTYPQVFLSSNSPYAVSGNCLFFKSSKDTPLYAILPQFDEDIAGLRLNFTYRNEGTGANNGTLIVGYMTDLADATTFTEVLTCAQTTTLTAKEVLFTNAPAGSYIAFKYQGGTANNYYMSIDNVSVTIAPTCLKPTELKAATTPNSATLSWTANNEETEWTVYYREVTDEPGDYTEVTGVTENPYTLANLDAATEYEFYVVAHCSEADASEPSVVTSFFTKCDFITDFPWSEDFEDFAASSTGVKLEDPCWENKHLEGSGTYFFEVYSGTNGTNTTKQLRLHDMAIGTLTKLVLPGMTLPNDNYQFTIDVYRSSAYSSKIDEGIRVYASVDGEIEGATELAFIPRVYSVESGIIPAEEAGNVWYTYSLPIGMSGNCYIILRGESQYGTATYMDNFVVEEIPASTVTQTLELTAGYNWVSTYIDGDPIELLEALQEALGDNGVSIEGPEGLNENLGDGFWWGDLDYVGITSGTMYLILVEDDCEVSLTGMPVDPSTVEITINPGYNWIGFPGTEEVDVEVALEEFEAEDGDAIEGPEGMTEYLGDGMWWGDFDMFVPGQGYMYNSASGEVKTLIFKIDGAKISVKTVSPK